ncbi:MAG: UDP-N-acetylmuramoyl-L-alanyl-D-glutamate--2,6-diaminopimelate ligase [Ruminococcaceae bacterium]|nr:UDP-N-acetylmuramoyl-L-alanyl-D-glutamate--2,6-diaminopimelate ligase [Oscillospiraceae bacterium]
MRLSTLLREAGISAAAGGADPEISGIASDSRRVRTGDLFVCIRGLHHDGHTHLCEVAAAGAAAAVVSEGCIGKLSVPVIRVPDTRAALACLWYAFLGHPATEMRLVAVTGTNGKTSVSRMLCAILQEAGERTGLIGTVGCRSGDRPLTADPEDPLSNMTTPDPADLYRMLAEMREDGVTTVVMEATSHALALGKLAPLHFAAGIFTNLTPEHLDFHGTMENYLAAKLKLFAACDIGIVNRDDPAGAAAAAVCRGRAVLCSQYGEADYLARNIRFRGDAGVEYRLETPDGAFGVESPIPGRFTPENSLLAAACARELGIPPHTVQVALARLSGIPGRMERVALPAQLPFSVYIDYAHTPDALEKLLRTARELRRDGGRVVLLFGCGGDRDPTKRKPMGRIAAEMADFVILTSDNSRGEDPETILREILRGMDRERPHTVIPNRAEAIAYAVETARKDDIILLAGKGHEQYEITRQGRMPFDEAALVRRAAAGWRTEKNT